MSPCPTSRKRHLVRGRLISDRLCVRQCRDHPPLRVARLPFREEKLHAFSLIEAFTRGLRAVRPRAQSAVPRLRARAAGPGRRRPAGQGAGHLIRDLSTPRAAHGPGAFRHRRHRRPGAGSGVGRLPDRYARLALDFLHQPAGGHPGRAHDDGLPAGGSGGRDQPRPRGLDLGCAAHRGPGLPANPPARARTG